MKTLYANYVTEKGLKKLKKELVYLSTVVRQRIAKDIENAVAYGDLPENAAWDTASGDRDLNESRIEQLQSLIKTSRKIFQRYRFGHEIITVGDKVEILDSKNNPMTVVIVGLGEDDPFRLKVSTDSPLGKALLGHKTGDFISAELPDGKKAYRINKIN